MAEVLTKYNELLLQIAIFVGIVCAIVIMLVITIKYIRKALRKVQSMYVEDEFSSRKKKKKSNYVVTSILIAAGIAVVFIILVIVANKEWGLALSPDHIVLTFVGIVATFIVITNYAQVSEIKKDVDGRFEQIERNMYRISKKMMRDAQEEKREKEEK